MASCLNSIKCHLPVFLKWRFLLIVDLCAFFLLGFRIWSLSDPSSVGLYSFVFIQSLGFGVLFKDGLNQASSGISFLGMFFFIFFNYSVFFLLWSRYTEGLPASHSPFSFLNCLFLRNEACVRYEGKSFLGKLEDFLFNVLCSVHIYII